MQKPPVCGGARGECQLGKHAAARHLEALLGPREEVDGQELQPRDQLLPLQHLRASERAQSASP